MYKLRYLAQAKDDLIGIKRYIAKESGSQQIALEYTGKLRAQCQGLAEFPGLAGRERSELRENIHSSPIGNYVIFFQYSGDRLEIVSIIEGHRDIEVLLSTQL
jgi:toxin ParE1/3/4